MQIIFTILSSVWMLVRNTPTAIRYLPKILALIGKIKEAFPADKVKEVFNMFIDMINNAASDTPQHDNTGNSIGDTEEEKQRRRFGRLRNRMDVASNITDSEAQEFCALHRIQHFETA